MVEPISFWGEHFRAVRERLSAHTVSSVHLPVCCTGGCLLSSSGFNYIPHPLHFEVFVLSGDFHDMLVKQSKFTTSMRSMQLESPVVLSRIIVFCFTVSRQSSQFLILWNDEAWTTHQMLCSAHSGERTQTLCVLPTRFALRRKFPLPSLVL